LCVGVSAAAMRCSTPPPMDCLCAQPHSLCCHMQVDTVLRGCSGHADARLGTGAAASSATDACTGGRAAQLGCHACCLWRRCPSADRPTAAGGCSIGAGLITSTVSTPAGASVQAAAAVQRHQCCRAGHHCSSSGQLGGSSMRRGCGLCQRRRCPAHCCRACCSRAGSGHCSSRFCATATAAAAASQCSSRASGTAAGRCQQRRPARCSGRRPGQCTA
jgi:hypothetical protein